ncbi:MAG TPA: choice-of-anchor Q domain-containing protein [Solirubrobacterales bacterium]|nr:choice-of-anchor Q domain-containing protein [Solirubrobacterales bacterium]
MRIAWISTLCAAMALALVAPATGLAATFTVNTTVDSDPVAGACTTVPSCSLREAVLAASASADAEDTVVVPPGTYAVEKGELAPSGTGSLVIRGAGARNTVVDAGGTSRVFNVGGDKVTIEQMTITGGSATEIVGEDLAGDGGGIIAYAAEELTLNGVNVSGNVATQNGAGLSAPPESGEKTAITINDSTIANNKVTGGLVEGLGGGVFVMGKLRMTNSTVTGNSVESTGVIVQGGGVLLAIDPASTEGSEATIVNSTIVGNSVGNTGLGGGIAVYNPEPMMGGSAALSLTNTIVAGNTGPMGTSNCTLVALAVSDHNLSDDATCMFTDEGSRQDVDPKLAPLANDGGETDTMALLAGSPAFDGGTNAGCPPLDQRGVVRPQGPSCDIGAFEQAQTQPPGQPGAPARPSPPGSGTGASKADLRVQIKPQPKRPQLGGKLAFLVTVSNRGPSKATGVVLKGTVPALTSKVKGAKVNGKHPCTLGKVKGGKRKLTCRLGDLADGKSKKLRVVVATEKAGKVRMRARVRSGLSDPNLKDNKARRGVKISD